MIRGCWTIVVLLMVLSVACMQAQIPRVLSYQGMLLGSNKLPVADGQYALTFKLYNGTNVVWTEVQTLVTVSGGMFNVSLGSVTPLSIPFDKAYNLGIQVGSDPELQPRMPLTSAAYAIRAEDADKLLGYSASSIPAPNKLLPLDSTGKFPPGVISGGSGSGDFLKKNAPDSSRGTSTGPIVLVSNLGSGDGLNGRSASGVGIAGRSTSNDGVSGWTGTSSKSGVFGFSTAGAGVTGHSDSSDGLVGWTGAGGKSGVFGHTSAANAFGVTGLAEMAQGIGVYGFNNASGNFGKLGTETHGLDVMGLARFVLPTGQISISTPGGWPGIISFSQNGHRRDVIVFDDGMSFEVSTSSAPPAAGNGITVLENGNVGVGTTTPGAKLDVLGTVKCAALTLTGGSDIAEPFDIKKSEMIEAGMVMVIDPNNPGKLKVADKAYDTHVAGVISGAGGISPGMLMSQSGSVADGEFPVALTGRVYCFADASGGSIAPGDLLTTSNIPGYAMKVTDYRKAQGAILGKAMSTLDHKKGLVLILVTLQ